MQVIVDRIENNMLVLEKEDGSVYNVPKDLIPDAQEGDVIEITIKKDETNLRKNKVENLVNELFK